MASEDLKQNVKVAVLTRIDLGIGCYLLALQVQSARICSSLSNGQDFVAISRIQITPNDIQNVPKLPTVTVFCAKSWLFVDKS